jgi:two-component system sensor histidine kinase HydH
MDELLGPSFEQFRPWIEQALKGDCRPNEARLALPDGRERFVRVQRVPDPGGDGYYVLVTDITEQKRQEEFVERMTRLAATGTFAAAIAHEVKTPLASAVAAIAAARGFLAHAGQEASAQTSPQSSAQATALECLTHAEAEINRMNQVVKSVENYASTGELALQSRDLFEIVTLAAARNRRPADEAAVRIETHPPARPLRLPLDAIKMEQVLINLIENAVQACRPGGLVAVRVNGPDQAVPDQAAADGTCSVIVEDDGCGMTAEQRARIFEPFYTTRGASGGTGFGLSVAQGIVAAHGGTIEVESEPGRGTRFTVHLPLQAAPSQS